MSKCSIPLNNIKVAAPCQADWNGMIGNDRVRFCCQCNLNVYNLSSMSRKDAEDLIQSTEGRLCVRYYRRNDGTVITDNCPVGLRALKLRTKRILNAVASAVLSFAAGLGVSSAFIEKVKPNVGVMGTTAIRESVMGDVGPAPSQNPPRIDVIQGGIRPVQNPLPVSHSRN